MKYFNLILLILFCKLANAQLDSGLVMYAPFDGNYINKISGAANMFNAPPNYSVDRSAQGTCAIQISSSNMMHTDYSISKNNRFAFSFFFKVNNPNQKGVIIGRIPALALNKDTLQFIDWFSPRKLSFKLTLMKWHHIAFYFDGIYSTAYVDGTLLGSYQLGSYFEAFFYIGNGHEFELDDFRIYNRLLSIEEIFTLRNMASSCSITGVDAKVISPPGKASVIGSYTLLGQKIDISSNFTGPMILLYSDGSRRKVFPQQ